MHFQTWLSIFHFIKDFPNFHALLHSAVIIYKQPISQSSSGSWQGNDDDLNPDQDQLLVLAGPSCSDQRCPQRLIPALPKSPISSISRPSAIIIVTTIVIVIVIITTTNEAQAVILAAEAQLFNPTSGDVLFPCVFFGIGNAKTLPILTHFWLFCRKFTHILVHFNRPRLCTQTN